MRVLGSFPRLSSSPVLGISGVYRGYARPTGLCGPMTTLPRCNPQRSESSFRQSLRSVRWEFFALSIHCPGPALHVIGWFAGLLYLGFRDPRCTYGNMVKIEQKGHMKTRMHRFPCCWSFTVQPLNYLLDLVRLQFITSVSLDRGIKSSGKNSILSFDVVVLTSRRVLPNSATSISIVYLWPCRRPSTFFQPSLRKEGVLPRWKYAFPPLWIWEVHDYALLQFQLVFLTIFSSHKLCTHSVQHFDDNLSPMAQRPHVSHLVGWRMGRLDSGHHDHLVTDFRAYVPRL